MSEALLNRPLSIADEPLDSEHILACPRVPYTTQQKLVEECGRARWFESFKTRPFDCCKNPENVDIEAWWTKPLEKEKGPPDLYKFHCRVCEQFFMEGVTRPGRERPAGFSFGFFCVGGNHPTDPTKLDLRPFWETR